jgi:hypothetical protein
MFEISAKEAACDIRASNTGPLWPCDWFARVANAAHRFLWGNLGSTETVSISPAVCRFHLATNASEFLKCLYFEHFNILSLEVIGSNGYSTTVRSEIETGMSHLQVSYTLHCRSCV